MCTACSSDQLTSSAGCDASVFIERSNALVFTEAHLYPRVSFSKTINWFFLNNVPVSGADSGFLCSFCLLKYTVQAVFSVRMEGFYNDKWFCYNFLLLCGLLLRFNFLWWCFLGVVCFKSRSVLASIFTDWTCSRFCKLSNSIWLGNKLKRYLELAFLLYPLYLETFCSYLLFLDTTENSQDTSDYMDLFSGRVPE